MSEKDIADRNGLGSRERGPRSGERAQRDARLWQEMFEARDAALAMIREAVEEIFGPSASLESEEAVLLRGPEPQHEAQAIIAALQRVADERARIRNEALEEAHQAAQAAHLGGGSAANVADAIEALKVQNHD